MCDIFVLLGLALCEFVLDPPSAVIHVEIVHATEGIGKLIVNEVDKLKYLDNWEFKIQAISCDEPRQSTSLRPLQIHVRFL